MPKLVIPPPLRGPTQGAAAIEVAGGTVRACLEAAEARFPGFGAQVLTPRGETHRFVRLFLNGASLPAAGLDRTVGAGDEITILAAIAGG
jgi:molybdopterin converting factor small subunit